MKRISKTLVSTLLAITLILTCNTAVLAYTNNNASTAASNGKITVTNIVSTTTYMKVGNKLALQTKVTPTSLKNKKLVFKTSNKNIATISTQGIITAKKAGNATITISLKANPKVKKTLKIAVVKKVAGTTNSQGGKDYRYATEGQLLAATADKRVTICKNDNIYINNVLVFGSDPSALFSYVSTSDATLELMSDCYHFTTLSNICGTVTVNDVSAFKYIDCFEMAGTSESKGKVIFTEADAFDKLYTLSKNNYYLIRMPADKNNEIYLQDQSLVGFDNTSCYTYDTNARTFAICFENQYGAVVEFGGTLMVNTALNAGGTALDVISND